MRISTAQTFIRGINVMNERQVKLSHTQEQLASGKRIVTPSDDPSGAARILDIQEATSAFEQFNRNAGRAQSDLGVEESALRSVTNMLQRVRELSLQAINGSLTTKDRQYVASEMEQRLDQLIQTANTKSGNEFIFAGFKSATQPFNVDPAGNVNYVGDQGKRELQISPSRYVAINDSGFDVFMDVRDGNGTFTTAAAATNTGGGVIDNGSLVAGATYVQDTYTIDFVTNANGDLAYTVIGATSGQVVPALPAAIPANAPAFTSGDTITFNNGQVTIEGTPVAGDSFTVAPASNKDIFGQIRDLIAAINGPSETTGDYAVMASTANSSIGGIDNALDNIDRVIASVGGRINAMNDEVAANETAMVELKTTRSRIEDLDYAEAIGDFQLDLAGLQAAQQAFAKIQNLSLFNFI